ncbi:NitT/TauT family transport system ATP-binding protein [Paenibacillus sp. UNCCL117]|uniref:ABC transporter ATP-binding protein n=1 Tax=unclassified Paenibacillus TaxID=185978 RepID=UPI00088FC747|nr:MULTISPECIES: ABC transporter ATP-binding protein [unclassified Paenibacillus]SDD01941.1 NitT/TauT family transport system ATP-binding protein [Paenibacillus sp. cl123]SFW32585.1 NitT/TauT family transport system ATP-binding protein [Paenibacillus sp. UNCCL117]
MSYLDFERITHTYSREGQPVLRDLSLRVAKGEFVSLLGRSGCGKTTLLKMAAGLLKPSAGSVRIGGEAVTKPPERMGMVFQAPTLLEWLTVLDNVLLPVALRGKPTKADRDAAESQLARLGLNGFGPKFPSQLSGGQQSRVALARALMREPSLLLLDEPFAALDALTREELQEELLQLCAARTMTVLFITHDIAEAVYVSDRVVMLQDGGVAGDAQVPLPAPRHYKLRYEEPFNKLCLALRQMMEGGERHEHERRA